MAVCRRQVDVLDDDTYIGAEHAFNLFTVRKNVDATTEDERSRLEVPCHVPQPVPRSPAPISPLPLHLALSHT